LWLGKVNNCIHTVFNARELAEQSFTDAGCSVKVRRVNALTVLLHSAALAVRDTKQGSESSPPHT
ncbi:hypothetical protein, partial [Dyella nitratireducens]|uniref:hypothetical protein n=1 Tax=Dyella nitratireducens TaxID=1849580 RepID=UPI001E362069